MPLKCIAIDDEPLALQLLKTYISRIPGLELVGLFEDAISGAEYIKKNKVDLMFLDVNMPDISGVDLARSLAERPMIIFTTAYKDFAFESYELQAVDYLLKPIDFSRFSTAVEKAIDFKTYKEKSRPNNADSNIFVYSEYKMVKISLTEIIYIESMGDYLKIHTESSDKPILTLMTMKKIIEKLPEEQFARIHRGFILALNRIKSIHNKKVSLETIELPIGESYQSFLNELKKKI